MDATELSQERTVTYVVFEIASEHYALEVNRVQEVLDVSGITSVPGSSKVLRGLFNLRGRVLPVWDLRALFCYEVLPLEPRKQCVMILERPGDTACGMLVDRVWDVLESQPEHLQPAPELGLGALAGYVRGVIRHQDRFLMVLDLDRVFANLTPGEAGHEAS
jgi:purine-binding chemotaxis protein CheW